MSSLNSILGNASSGIQASQTALRVVSDNVANVNTVGYTRKAVDQASVVSGSVGQGVTVADVKRVTNLFLEAANYTANAGASAGAAVAGSLDQAQGLFGDPSANGSLFSNLDSVRVGMNIEHIQRRVRADTETLALPDREAVDAIVTAQDLA